MGRRRQARELALQALYLSDVSSVGVDEAYTIVSQGSKLDPRSEVFARELSLGAAAHQATLDGHIEKVAQNWELKRMAAVDRSLLRLASYELLHCTDTPVNVIIDEALEIAKVYSSSDSSKFINGILDKVKTHRSGASRDQSPD